MELTLSSTSLTTFPFDCKDTWTWQHAFTDGMYPWNVMAREQQDDRDPGSPGQPDPCSWTVSWTSVLSAYTSQCHVARALHRLRQGMRSHEMVIVHGLPAKTSSDACEHTRCCFLFVYGAPEPPTLTSQTAGGTLLSSKATAAERN